MSDKLTLWVCGKYCGAPAGGGIVWELIGLFSSEAAAVAACRTDYYFVGPAVLNEVLPDEPISWPGCYYPLAVAV
jgi:hypothetical protein